MKYLQQLIRDYFGFSRTESRGLFLLLTLICLSILASIYYHSASYQSYSLPLQDQETLNALIGELEANIVKAETTQPAASENSLAIKRFRFDPNHASVQELITLGIPEFLSRRIEKYRSKGGKFYQPQDLLKIYGFQKTLYQELEDYIQITEKKNARIDQKIDKPEEARYLPKEEASPKLAEPEVFAFNINEADSLALQQLSGIGQVTASRIVRFRDKLGGIHTLDQLKEVYHISEEALQSLEEYAFVDEKFETQKININQADFKTLLAHPYISYEVAKAIMNHRRIYGNFTSKEQLKEVYQINEELLVKLLPYLVI